MPVHGRKLTPIKEESHQPLSDMSDALSTQEHLVLKVNGEECVNQTRSSNNINLSASATGHVVIKDADTGEVLVDDHNDVHIENLGEAIALCLARYDNGYIEKMAFGNNGTVLSSTGEIYYNKPNVTGINAGLYNETYSKVVNDRSPYFSDNPDSTHVSVKHEYGNNYTDIIINCLLNFNEPADAAPYDDLTAVNGQSSKSDYGKYIFDEIGIKSVNYNTGVERLLTHIIFNPIQKSLNRAIEIDYTLRILIVPY